MADRCLIISWGASVRGREQHGLEVFEEALAYYGEQQAAGAIEAFDVILAEPNGLMDGCMLLRGTHAQLDKLREDMRFRKLLVDASLIVEDLRIIEGFTGEGIGEQMPLYQEAVGHVPQMA
jgi:hypothetical protein